MSARDLPPSATAQADRWMTPERKAAGDAWLARLNSRVLEAPYQADLAAWRGLSIELREVLLSLCTDRRDVQRDAGAAWGSFTDDERATMGSMARQWVRELQGARWLR